MKNIFTLEQIRFALKAEYFACEMRDKGNDTDWKEFNEEDYENIIKESYEGLSKKSKDKFDEQVLETSKKLSVLYRELGKIKSEDYCSDEEFEQARKDIYEEIDEKIYDDFDTFIEE